ncbi:hypothetical protein RclHR1_00680013 [Rhizophagus clarus]|uniref:HCP-like protein n=1 Tax=Rhizophagus clarus TaxID=94130 RepID=A0A2Z6SJV8_9GLOM|nr:hypothetical protein RclHR1_00680013 [Rhizophagus clarus]
MAKFLDEPKILVNPYLLVEFSDYLKFVKSKNIYPKDIIEYFSIPFITTFQVAEKLKLVTSTWKFRFKYRKYQNATCVKYVIKQHVLDYINNHKLDLHEFYNWFLNNQNNSNSIYLFGYFNYHGINVIINKQKAYKLFEKVTKLENYAAQFDLAFMCIDGEGCDQNYNKAFEISKKLAKKGYSCGINLLAYCYKNGIGPYVNMQKAFELFQKAANLNNSLAQYNLALMYENGNGTEKNIHQAIFWYIKSAEQGDIVAQDKLKELLPE